MKSERNLVLVVAATDREKARRALAVPPAGVDLLELRIDRLPAEERTAPVIADLVRAAALPVIATCRPIDESGFHDGPDAERWALLSAALGAGARLVDIEWSRIRRDSALASRWPADRLLLSHHAGADAGHAIEDDLLAMTRVEAAGVKLVSMSPSFAESMRLVELTRHFVRSGRRVTCFSAGAAALAGRVLGYLAGAWLTYLVPDDETGLVPSIPHASELLTLYRLPAQGQSVKLLGLAGYPLGHSLSPRMQNGVIRVLGERYLMLPLESPSIAEVVDFVRHHDIRGLAVTRPHKETIVPLLDGLDATAQFAGAVNTVVRDHARLVGWNTDLVAMRTILREWSAGPDDRAVVLGAGGAARAVVAALTERHVPVTLLNRDPARARLLAEDFAGVTVAGKPDALDAADGTIFVQATPLGAGEEVVRVPAWLGAGGRLLDLAYRDGGTPLETAARAAGHRVVGGHDFLARQGAAQFALWTGRLVNADLFREALGTTLATREAAC